MMSLKLILYALYFLGLYVAVNTIEFYAENGKGFLYISFVFIMISIIRDIIKFIKYMKEN